jgi:hypothetical protein
MNRSYQADRDRFLLELELYLAKAREHARHQATPFFDQQLDLLRKNLNICITELETADQLNEAERYKIAYDRAQDCLDEIAALVGGENDHRK